MQLTHIKQLTGTLVLKTGLHIGAGDTEMRIGGTDNPVVKDPLSGQPIIPGSSLKGKIRSLLEWRHGLVSAAEGKPFSFQHLQKQDSPAARDLLKLFGGAPGGEVADLVRDIGPTRLAFWDCALDTDRVTPAEVQQLLIAIGTTGFGRDASIGLGKFALRDLQTTVPPAPTLANAYWTLPCAMITCWKPSSGAANSRPKSSCAKPSVALLCVTPSRNCPT